jgi:ATP-dependent RNA helicase RhlE
VLDEADRMSDMGFIRDIRKIVERCSKERCRYLAPEIRDLAHQVLRNPALVEVARRTLAELVPAVIRGQDERAMLLHLFEAHGWHQVLVFCRTKHGADALARKLEQSGVRTAALHGNKSQNARTRALADFKSGKLAALVATDIAARGLDIDSLPRVVNFELPNVPEIIHRTVTGAPAPGRSDFAGQQRGAHSVARHRTPDQARIREADDSRFRAAAQRQRAACGTASEQGTCAEDGATQQQRPFLRRRCP